MFVNSSVHRCEQNQSNTRGDVEHVDRNAGQKTAKKFALTTLMDMYALKFPRHCKRNVKIKE